MQLTWDSIRDHRKWFPAAMVAAFVGCLLLSFGLGAGYRPMHFTASLDEPPAKAQALQQYSSENSLAANAASESEAPAPPAEDDIRKIMRTGSLDLIVSNPADMAQRLGLLAANLGGYIETSEITGTKDAPSATVTIRVPAARFEEAKAQLRKMAIRVEGDRTEATDVTKQYVDMDARLRNLKAEEAQYLLIMKSASKVQDMLEVTEKIGEVRGQIEQQQAEFNALSKQIETASIQVSMHAEADTAVFGLHWRPLYQLKLALRNSLDGLAEYAAAMASFLLFLPVLVLWGGTVLAGAVLAWRILRWAARRFFGFPKPHVQPASAS